MIITRDLLESSAVVDNNILVDLYELKRLDILFHAFALVSIPMQIYQTELPDEVKKEVDRFDFQVSVIDSERGYDIYQKLTTNYDFRNLSAQDKSAISIAAQFQYYCNSNDALVKKACLLYDIKHIGILGLLERAYALAILDFCELSFLAYELASNRTSCYIKKDIVEDFVNSLSEKEKD